MASSSFVLAAARLRALSLTHGRAAGTKSGSREESQQTVPPA